MNLNGKVVIITGGTRGIGKGIALEFIKKGASVALNYASNDEMANKTLSELKELGGSVILVKGSVAKIDDCKRIIETTINSFGKIDFLINNAGISKLGLLMDATDEEIDEIFNVNLRGTVNMSKYCLSELMKTQGAIVNISSIWGNVGASYEVLYSTTKGAINTFTKALAKEMAMAKIRVNCISPGVIETEMNSWMSKEDRAGLEEEIPMNRFGSAAEIGKVAVFLCSDEASYVTGQIITVDGGML